MESCKGGTPTFTTRKKLENQISDFSSPHYRIEGNQLTLNLWERVPARRNDRSTSLPGGDAIGCHRRIQEKCFNNH